MIPMEGVRTWGEAFKKMLEAEGTIAPSRLVPVWEQLKLPADLKEKELGEIHSAVWKKLQELAKNERILLLLDNVDNTEMLSEKQLQRLTFGPRIPDNIDIIATTRVEYKFGKNDNAVNYEIDTLDEKSAITMFGNICGNAIPCLQCPPPDDDQSEQSDLRAENRAEYSAMCAIVRLLENHPWSLEIVAGYLCQHYDNYDDYDEWGAVKKAGFQKKFAELQKDFQISEHEEASSWRNVDSVVKLLEPTINKLKETPAVFELACAAALLPPDCIPNFILIRYWNTFFPDVKFSSGNSFAEVMKMLQNYHIVRLESTFVKMHRLTASVLKDEIIKKSQEQSLILEKLNTVLLSISNEDWIKVLSHSPELLNSAPIENFSIIEIAKISHVNPKILKSLPNLKYCSTQILIRALTEQPAIADLLDEKIFFSGNDYVQLLSGTPQFANHSNLICEFISTSDWVQLLLQVPDMGINCPWDELTAQNWVQLLRNQPQFADKCDWDKLDGADWCELLKEQPQFADKCNWEKLDKLGCSVWQTLLQEQPQFTDKCDWNKFDGNAWCNLLMELPQFADRCDWDKLNGVNWCNLLKRQPQFADKCDWDKLDGIDWCRLLEEQPQFANNCEVLVIFDEYKWCKILQKEPDLEASKYCDFNAFNGCLWRNLLSVQPQFADKCDWDKLDGADWCELLKEQPQFANICNWDKINSSLDWKCFSSLCKLLAEQPQFIYQCSCLELIDGNDWVQILKKQPQLADKCDWEKLDGADWCKLLMEQPQFADKCDWKKIDIHTRNVYGESAVCNLLISQPQLIDKINCLADFSSYEWHSILRKQPQLADKCDWTALDDLDDLAWRRLLEEQPQFADKCNWQKLDETYCVEFLRNNPSFIDSYLQTRPLSYELLKIFPELKGRFSWHSLNIADWIDILKEHPEFENIFISYQKWEKIDGNQWCSLIIARPYFAAKCIWQKLNEYNWLEIVSVFPQFGELYNCPWEKFDGYCWYKLLEQQPVCAEKYPGGLLTDTQWRELLCRHPQLSGICDWKKLTLSDWEKILSEHPMLKRFFVTENFGSACWHDLLIMDDNWESQCIWEELDVNEWWSLLLHKPQFAKYCNKEKFSKFNDRQWVGLILQSPELYEYCDPNIQQSPLWERYVLSGKQ